MSQIGFGYTPIGDGGYVNRNMQAGWSVLSSGIALGQNQQQLDMEREMMPSRLEHLEAQTAATELSNQYNERTLDTRARMLDLQVDRMAQGFRADQMDTGALLAEQLFAGLAELDNATFEPVGVNTSVRGGVVVPDTSASSGAAQPALPSGGGGALPNNPLFFGLPVD